MWTPDESERYRYSEQHPGFSGRIEFETVFDLFGRRIKRRARLDYTCTPDWEYFDLNKRALHRGWAGTNFTMAVLAIPERWLASGRRKAMKGRWIAVGELLQDGIFPESLYDRMYAAIESACRGQDRERRRLAAEGKRLPRAPVGHGYGRFRPED